MNHPAEMYRYHAWANQTILERLKELPSSVLSQEVNSSFPTIAHALSHIYAVDRTWYLVLTGMGMPEAVQTGMPLNANILHTVDEYVDLFARLSEQFGAWFESEADLERTILLDNPFAGLRQTRLSEIVLHLVNHGTYHRGNVSTMLRQLGHASVMHDYALFWYQEPARSI
ncbi:DinB family protein [Paenibacillus xanthanilyticus]|uniref:DinB family protein n=1 Tax=Paenibacillus xanthanilyticus TaxID=1783531 RepID=A0ABV8K937_9BACL